jgi:hypothetical protein
MRGCEHPHACGEAMEKELELVDGSCCLMWFHVGAGVFLWLLNYWRKVWQQAWIEMAIGNAVKQKHSSELECFCIAIFIVGFECAIINIEGWLKILISYLVYDSQIWLNLPRYDPPFFSLFLCMGDHHLRWIKKFPKESLHGEVFEKWKTITSIDHNNSREISSFNFLQCFPISNVDWNFTFTQFRYLYPKLPAWEWIQFILGLQLSPMF